MKDYGSIYDNLTTIITRFEHFNLFIRQLGKKLKTLSLRNFFLYKVET